MAVLFQGIGSGSGNTGNLNVGWPTHQTDDIGILVVITANEAIADPAGSWTRLTSTPVSDGTPGAAGGLRLTAFWKRAASNAESVAAVLDSGSHQYGRIITVRGAATGNSPIDAETASIKTPASTASSIPGVTTAQGGNDVLYVSGRDYANVGAQGTNVEANANLTGLTKRADAGYALGFGGGLVFYTGNLAVAGPTGTLTDTLANSTTEAYLCVAFLAPYPQPPRSLHHFRQRIV